MSGTSRQEREALLVLRALGLGDFLTGLPAMRALERAFPDHQRLLAAPGWLRPLAGLAGWELVDFSLGESPLSIDDRPSRPVCVAVNLHGRGPQSHEAILPLQPATFLAFQHPGVRASSGFPIHCQGEHEVLRWCRMLDEFGIPADPADLNLPVPRGWGAEERALIGAMADAAPGAALIHPGAASPARRWPWQRWAEVARALTRDGKTVLLTGSRAERDLAEQIRVASALPAESNLAGKTGLVTLCRLVAEAGLAMSADTGFAHLATAMGTPSVILFGPISPQTWGPPPDRPQHKAIWKGRPGDPHGMRTDPGLLQIGVPEVLRAIASVETARIPAP